MLSFDKPSNPKGKFNIYEIKYEYLKYMRFPYNKKINKFLNIYKRLGNILILTV